MKKVVSFVLVLAMVLALAVGFIGFALGHPEASWPWSNGVSYTIYGVYLGVMVLLFIAPFQKKR